MAVKFFSDFIDQLSPKAKKLRTKTLVQAITLGQEELAISLLNKGTYLTYVDEQQKKTNILALCLVSPEFKPGIITKLLELGANPNESAGNARQQPQYASLPDFSIWHLAALTGNKEAVEYFTKTCTNLKLKMGDFTIIDFLKPQDNKEIQAIYKATLKEMDAILLETYKVNPVLMEDALIAALESNEMPILSKEQSELTESTNAMAMLTSLNQAEPLKKSLLLHAYRMQKNMRSLLSGTSTLHAEIADLISDNLQLNPKTELTL